MSIIIKSEHSSVVELSSDDEEIVSAINKEIPTAGVSERPSTPDTQCSICLDDLTNKCYSNSCWHLFCFECLKRWSNTEPTCPLCKKDFVHIYHTFTDEGVHETYDVPVQEIAPIPRIFMRPIIENIANDANRMYRMNLFLDIVRRNENFLNNINDFNHNDNSDASFYDPNVEYASPAIHRPIMGQASRIRVYIDNAWADPLPDTNGRFRDCTSAFFRNNPAQTYRLHGFILRDLIAVREAARVEGRGTTILETADVSITNLIMRSISTYEIRESFMSTILQPFLDEHTTHFCHELFNFANSPYDIIGYDRHVRYTYRSRIRLAPLPPPPTIQDRPASLVWPQTRTSFTIPVIPPPITIYNEVIVLDSDNEEAQMPNAMDVIVVSSGTDDSEVELISFNPIETLSSSSIDQPSTSTGIRNSSDRPNTRYNLRRRRLVSPAVNGSSSYPAHVSRMVSGVRRGRPIVDSSSDDEESTPQARMKSRSISNKKKRKTKKTKHRKRKRNIFDSRSDFCSGNRSRSYSESSSSSGDTDARPNNSCLYKSCILPK